jgi:hypothetical protein
MTDQLAALQERWLWLWASFILGLVVAWVEWIFREAHNPRMRNVYERWRRWPGHPWLVQSLRMLYAVGLPAAALIWRGALTERGLGLQPFPWTKAGLWSSWVEDIGRALATATGTGALLLLTTYQLRRLQEEEPAKRRDGLLALREAFYYEAHWTFYREPFVLLWGVGTGSWAGFLLILIEMMVNPLRWQQLRQRGKGRNLLIRGALAVTSTLIFIQTQNVWCGLLVDFWLSWAMGFAETEGQG